MKLPKSLTTVTKFSKILAVVIFFTFLFTAFLAGMKYQEMNALLMESKKTFLPISTPSPTPIAIPTIDPSITENSKTTDQISPTKASSPCPTGLDKNIPC